MSSNLNLADTNTLRVLKMAVKGNEDAFALLVHVATLAREIDDMADELIEDQGDRQRRISRIVELSLVNIGCNKFYLQHLATLSAALMVVLAQWRMADELRYNAMAAHTPENVAIKSMHFGYVWRESTDQFFMTVAAICGGHVHAKDAMHQLFNITHAESDDHPETWLSDNLPVETAEE